MEGGRGRWWVGGEVVYRVGLALLPPAREKVPVREIGLAQCAYVRAHVRGEVKVALENCVARRERECQKGGGREPRAGSLILMMR